MCDYQKVSEKCDVLLPAKSRVFVSTPIQKDDHYTHFQLCIFALGLY